MSAIIVGQNIIHESWFDRIEVDGTWTDEEHLLTSQLSPAAQFAAGASGIEFWSAGIPPASYNAIVLAGTSIGVDGYKSTYSLVVERFLPPSWVSLEYSAYEIASPGSPRTLVILFKEFVKSTAYRVRWHSNLAGEVGAVMLGQVIENSAIADAGWRMGYVDAAAITTSEGGQIYAGPPELTRALDIPADQVDSRLAWGVQRILETIDLPAVQLANDAQLDGDWIEVPADVQGTATWPGVFQSGRYYRVDYEQQLMDLEPGESPSFIRWGITPSSLSIGSDQAYSTSRASVYGQAFSTDMVWGGASGDGTARFKILGVHEIDFEPGGFNLNPHLLSLQSMWASHGRGRPIVAMIRPTDPIINRATGIYGHLSERQELQHVPGDADIWRTFIRITEAR